MRLSTTELLHVVRVFRRIMTCTLEMSSTGQKLHVGLVTNVSNTMEVREKVVKGELNCTMVRSCLVPSTLVVATAANKACLAQSRGNMKTRSINTEILFNMSSSSNITDSLNKFGGQDSDTAFLVVSVDKELIDAKDVIKGDWIDTKNLIDYVNRDLLIKLHKLKTEELYDLTGALCSRISAKDSL